MEKQKSETITLNKNDLWKYSTFVLIGVMIIGAVLYFSFGKGLTGNVVANPAANIVGVTAPVDVEIGDSPILGDKDAPVTIVEFSDYECPYCGRHFTDTYPQIKSNYIDTGEVNLVFKNFPLNFHPNAQKAAEAAECAREQGKFWEMHDKLFENQVTLSVENYKIWAKGLGLDAGKFNTCLDTGKMAKVVQDDLKYGQEIGVQGTPAFFIGNGDSYTMVSGAQPYSAFEQVIEAKLAA